MSSNGNRDTWVVVRCFNEAAVVGQVVRELRTVFDNVVGVDDGSEDNSAAQMREAGAFVVRHPVNLGPGSALQTGVSYALTDPDASYVLCFDADGQHRVEDATAMLTRIREGGIDILIGSRFLGATAGMPPGRRGLLRAAAWFERISSGVRLSDGHNGLRAFTRRFAERVHLHHAGMAYASELLALIARTGLPYAEHPVTVVYTPYSRSKGQRNINSVNIALDVWVDRVLGGSQP